MPTVCTYRPLTRPSHTSAFQVQLYRAVTQMSLFMYLKAAFSFRSSWKAFCNLPHQQPLHKKPAVDTQGEGHQSMPAPDEVTYMRQFGMGFFLYLLSMIPNAFGFILRHATGPVKYNIT